MNPVRLARAVILALVWSMSLVAPVVQADSHRFKPAHLDFEQGLQWQLGKAVFDKLWVAAPSSTTSSDGLGPLYNARSCQQCHDRAHTTNASTIRAHQAFDASSLFGPALVLKFGRGDINTPDPIYGHQLQPFAVTGLAAEGVAQVQFQAHAIGGERIWQPVWSVNLESFLRGDQSPSLSTRESQGEGKSSCYHASTSDLSPPLSHPLSCKGIGELCALDQTTQLSPRLATPLVGSGWLELIPDADLIALSDPEDKNRDGISGRTNLIGANKAIGRFGWKAGQASLTSQALQALNHDIGISSALFPHPQGDCTTGQPECLRRMEADGTPEASADLTAALLFFLQQQPAPEAPKLDADGIAGQQLFQTLHCSTCHHLEFTWHLNGKETRIALYSDLLLHDMGVALSDDLTEHAATAQEWRTPPLWGLGQQLKLGKRTSFMHDGRARSLHEAILHHAGEAETSRTRYQELAPPQRAQLIHFLESL